MVSTCDRHSASSSSFQRSCELMLCTLMSALNPPKRLCDMNRSPWFRGKWNGWAFLECIAVRNLLCGSSFTIPKRISFEKRDLAWDDWDRMHSCRFVCSTIQQLLDQRFPGLSGTPCNMNTTTYTDANANANAIRVSLIIQSAITSQCDNERVTEVVDSPGKKHTRYNYFTIPVRDQWCSNLELENRVP